MDRAPSIIRKRTVSGKRSVRATRFRACHLPRSGPSAAHPLPRRGRSVSTCQLDRSRPNTSGPQALPPAVSTTHRCSGISRPSGLRSCKTITCRTNGPLPATTVALTPIGRALEKETCALAFLSVVANKVAVSMNNGVKAVTHPVSIPDNGRSSASWERKRDGSTARRSSTAGPRPRHIGPPTT